MVLGQSGGCIGCCCCCVFPLVDVTVRIDDTLVAPGGEISSESDHLLVGIDGFRGLVLFVVDDAETIEKDGAVALFRL